MKSSVVLLPPDVARSLYKAFEGESSARFDNVEKGKASQHNPLDHLINVERMLLADMQAFPSVFSDHVGRHDERGCMNKLELIRDLYGFFKTALAAFGDTISKHEPNKQPAGSSASTAQPSRRPERPKPSPPPPPPHSEKKPPQSGTVKEKQPSFFGRLFGGLFGRKK